MRMKLAALRTIVRMAGLRLKGVRGQHGGNVIMDDPE